MHVLSQLHPIHKPCGCEIHAKIDQSGFAAHTELKGDLKKDIESTFGSVENFNKEFSTAGATQVQLERCCYAGCLSF